MLRERVLRHVAGVIACALALSYGPVAVGEIPEAQAADRCQELIAQLDDPDRFARKRTIRAMVDLGVHAQAALPVLAQRVRAAEEDEDVRLEAAKTLVRLTPEIPEAKRHLLDLMRECSDRTCLFAAEAWRIGKLPLDDESVSAFAALLEGQDPSARQIAAAVFADAGTAATPAVPLLIEALDENQVAAAYYSGIALVKLGIDDKETVDQLTHALRHNSSKAVRKSCAELLGILGRRASQAATPLLEALSDPDEDVRRAALEALSGPGRGGRGVPITEADAPALLAGLQSDDERERKYVSGFFSQPREAERPWMVPLVESALRHPDKQIRRTAASLLWKVDTQGLFVSNLILEAWQDSDPEVRKAAFHAASEFSRPRAGPLLVLLAATKDPDSSIRRKALAELSTGWNLGPDVGTAVPDIARYLSDESKETRRLAILVLGRIGADSKGTVPQLIEILCDDDLDIRSAAGYALALIGKTVPTVVDDVGATFQGDDVKLRVGAAESLGRFDFQGDIASRLLAERIQVDPDPTVREIACRSLLKLGPEAKAAFPLLMNALADEDVAAARSLANAKEAVPALMEAIQRTNNDKFRAACIQSLGQMAPDAREAVPMLIRLLDSPNETHSAAVKALGLFGADAESTLPHVLPLLKAENSHGRNARISAIKTVGRLGSQSLEAVAALEKTLSDERADIRVTAVRVLGEMGPIAQHAVPSLADTLSDADAQVRRAAANSLMALGAAAKAAVPALGLALTDEDLYVRSYVINCLGSMGEAAAEAVPALREFVNKSDSLTERLHAHNAITKILGPDEPENP